jgi:hypothetical protein
VPIQEVFKETPTIGQSGVPELYGVPGQSANPISDEDAKREVGQMERIYKLAKREAATHDDRTTYLGYKSRLEKYCAYKSTAPDNEYCKRFKKLGDLPK